MTETRTVSVAWNGNLEDDLYNYQLMTNFHAYMLTLPDVGDLIRFDQRVRENSITYFANGLEIYTVLDVKRVNVSDNFDDAYMLTFINSSSIQCVNIIRLVSATDDMCKPNGVSR